MVSVVDLPENARLAEVALSLDRARASAWIVDADLRLVWMSEEGIGALRLESEDEVGIDRHIVECLMSEPWMKVITPESAVDVFLETMPLILADPKMAASIPLDALPEQFQALIGAISPADHQPPLWSSGYTYLSEAGDVAAATWLVGRIHDVDGTFLGAFSLYTPVLRARVMMMLATGDEALYERMARLTTPARRSAAILFADLEDSGVLSRGLSSAAYFALVRDLTSAIDSVVVRNNGIIGKHAGDGMTSFFLTEDHGSDSAAARAALESARAMVLEARAVAKALVDVPGNFDSERIRVNIGLHWGGTLYMGQLVTGGRLEVTALGDEVNECARIQETAGGGAILASKAILERLDGADASALGLDPNTATYQTIGSIRGVSAKAKRDAGSLAVSEL